MKKGFTLIELLVVIAIIALLSSVVLASLTSARMKSRDARRTSDLKQIQTALELFYDSKGRYPTGGATCDGAADGEGSDRTDWKNNAGCTVTHPLGALKDAGFLSRVPTDPGLNTYIGSGPTCGNAQFYIYHSDGQKYVLGAQQEQKGRTGCDTSGGDWNGLTSTTNLYHMLIKNY
jgi:prepilin-type N-terminal cleavage/methylation domain-containing protein